MLQCIAVHCSALQCVAVHCSVLQYVAVRCSASQCVAVRCGVLQCIAVRCSVLATATRHVNTAIAVDYREYFLCCSLLQSAAVCCSLLQSVARCNTAYAAGYRAQWPFIIGLICAKRHPAKKQKSLQSSNTSLKFALFKNEP